MDVVVVTGFGLFGDYKVNASWEVAKELKNFDFESKKVKLVTEELTVAYGVIEDKVPQLWKLHEPKLMVHIGVSASASAITLEICANKSGYKKRDVEEKIPEGNASHSEGAELIKTCIDVEAISLQYNTTNKEVNTIISQDAGRYLCEFTFYTSLCVNPERTVFIHVPDIGKPYTVKQMSVAVYDIISLLLDQIRKNNC